MDTGVRAGPCCHVPGTRRSWEPWQDPRWGAQHPPVTVSAAAGRIQGLWWALGWGQGKCWPLGHCWGLWPPLQPWLVALGLPGRWAAAFSTSVRYIMWGCGLSGEVARGLYVPLWC